MSKIISIVRAFLTDTGPEPQVSEQFAAAQADLIDPIDPIGGYDA